MAKCVQSSEQLRLAFSGSVDAASGCPDSAASVPVGRHRAGRRRKATRAPRGTRCVNCGIPVPDHPPWLQGLSLHYCSPECRQAWVAEMPSFEVSVEGREGVARNRRKRGANWESQAQKARERDGFSCRVCGVTEEELGGRLDVHHQIPYRRFRSNVEANKLEHLITVCAACHGHLESRLRRELPLFASA